MKKIKRLLALSLAIFMLLALTACGSGGGDGSGGGGDAQGNQSAGADRDTLVVLSSEAFSGSWDPAGNTVLANVHLQAVVLSYLVELNYETHEVEPSLATSWEYCDDGYSMIFHLRDDVTFHDGSKFDAEDVKATVEWMSRPDSARGGEWGEQYLVEVIDEHTCRIYPSSEEPRAALLNLLTYYEAGILSSDDVYNNKLNEGLNGTGPYKVSKYENETVYLEKFDGYFDASKAAKIPHVEFRYVPESQTRLAALQSGEAHLIERVEAEQIPIIEGNQSLANTVAPVNEQKYMVFKTTQAPMDNPLVRKAIAYAIDVDTIIESIMDGNAVKADCWLAQTCTNYSVCDDFIRYDPDMAKQLLAEAGYPNGAGLPTLTYITSTGFYPKTKEYGEYIVSCLNEIGINVDFQPKESASWSEALYAEDSCHMIDTGWMIGNEDNEMLATCFNAPHGLMDFSTDETVFAAIAKESGTVDPAQRKQVIQDELWPALNDSLSMFPLFDSTMIWGFSSDLQGFKGYPTSNMLFNELSFAN